MKKKTRNLTQQVKDALLALPDSILMETIAQWLDLADKHLQYLEWTDEYRYAMGYRVQSDETNNIYASFDELHEAEPDCPCSSWVVPGAHVVRSLLTDLSVEQFYHTVIPLAGDALRLEEFTAGWGNPPSSFSDGYDFMRSLTIYLQDKASTMSKDEGIMLSQGGRGKKKKMKQ
jgi:hypothetical protein